MSDFRVTIRDGKTGFRPGEFVEGSAAWNIGQAPEAVELRLIWFTRGKGTPDVSIVDSSSMAAPAAMGDSAFRFVLPDGPHSFSGSLISLTWAVEAIALAPRSKPLAAGRAEFVLSPDGQEIVLPVIAKTPSALEEKFRLRKQVMQDRKSR